MSSPTQKWGALKEAIAEKMLVREGYRIIERNWRCLGGEIDRIAWHEGVLVFVEVRARSSALFGSPAETINRKKRRKLTSVATAYLSRFSTRAVPMARFDVVSIVDEGGAPSISLIKNAFEVTV